MESPNPPGFPLLTSRSARKPQAQAPEPSPMIPGGVVAARPMMARIAAARYLVVEDNAHMRVLLKDLLRCFGARQITEASDGAEALSEIRRCRPDVLITDWRMTPLDGLDLVRILRTAPDSPAPELPVILVTGHSDQWMVVQARDAGVNEFLVKPVAAQDLWRRLVEVLTKPRPFVRSAHYTGPCRRRNDRPAPGIERRATRSVAFVDAP